MVGICSRLCVSKVLKVQYVRIIAQKVTKILSRM